MAALVSSQELVWLHSSLLTAGSILLSLRRLILCLSVLPRVISCCCFIIYYLIVSAACLLTGNACLSIYALCMVLVTGMQFWYNYSLHYYYSWCRAVHGSGNDFWDAVYVSIWLCKSFVWSLRLVYWFLLLLFWHLLKWLCMLNLDSLVYIVNCCT